MIVLVLVVRINRRFRPIVDVDRRSRIRRVVRRFNERLRIAFVAFREGARRRGRFVRKLAQNAEIARATMCAYNRRQVADACAELTCERFHCFEP